MSDMRWDGYSSPEILTDSKPVSAEFAGCWPAGTPGVGAAGGEHQPQAPRHVVYPGEGQGKKKKRKPKPPPGGG